MKHYTSIIINVNDKLKSVRREQSKAYKPGEKFLKIMCFFIVGLILGFSIKLADSTPALRLFAQISDYLGLWCLLTMFIIVNSRSPGAACVHSFVFLSSMLISYYLYSMICFKSSFDIFNFLIWWIMVIVSLPFAYLLWYAQGNSILSDVLAAFPIGLSIAEGIVFLYPYNIPIGFSLLWAFILLIIIPIDWIHRLRVIFFAFVISTLIRKLRLVSSFTGISYYIMKGFGNLFR